MFQLMVKQLFVNSAIQVIIPVQINAAEAAWISPVIG
jgi:hypothetical protein